LLGATLLEWGGGVSPNERGWALDPQIQANCAENTNITEYTHESGHLQSMYSLGCGWNHEFFHVHNAQVDGSEADSFKREKIKHCFVTTVQDSDPDPHVFGPPGSGSGSTSQRYGSRSGPFYHQAKEARKTLIPTVLWLLLDILFLKNDVNVPSKSNNQNIFLNLVFCWRLEGQWRK
jgi:hypothetical protein